MLEILHHLFYIKNGKKAIENIIILVPPIFYGLMKIFFLTKKPFSLIRKRCCFLIDGAKINSKKDLYFTLNKICKFFIEKNKKKSPFFLILITNLNQIMIEDQIIFKKFLTEKAMVVKFFFLVSDFRFLSELVLSRSIVAPFYNSSNDLQIVRRFYGLSFRRIFNFENKQKSEKKFYQKKLIQITDYFNDSFIENLFKIKNLLSKLPQNLSNEIFVLIIFFNSFENYQNKEIQIAIKFFLNNKNYIKEYTVYQTLSTIQ